MKATLRQKTASNGTIAKLSVFRTLGESSIDEEISSFEDSKRISTTATRAPPTPKPIAVVMAIADDAAVVVVVAVTILDNIMVRSTISTI